MKKIAIITIQDNNNFGNRLQNYAMQEILKDFGDVYSLKNNSYTNKKISFFSMIFRRFYFVIRKVILSISIVKIKRIFNFKKFNKFIKYGEYISFSSAKKFNDKYDYFVVGSDQIWNLNFFRNCSDILFLKFCNSNKRVAISPSISCDSLTISQYCEFKNYLADFNNLSCREKQGSIMIESITGKKCVTLLDPTLMLSKEKWNLVSKKPKFHDENKRFILLYFLGNLSEEYNRIILSISEKYNLEVINIYDKKSKYFSIGPSEFIYLISKCELMLTDSFHGSVFSYIFDKPFKIFKRINGASMNSRLLNLIDTLNLNEDIYFNSKIDYDSLFNTNYNKDILKVEQDKFIDYVKSVIL